MGTSRALAAALVAAVLTLAGCATLDSTPMAPDAAWFDARMASSQFTVVSAAVEQWRLQNPDAPELAVFVPKLEAGIAQFRGAVIADAQQLQAEKRWADADQRLLAAMQQLPDDEVLTAAYAAFDQQREQQRLAVQREFDVAYAQTLPQLVQAARSVFELKPQDTAAATQLQQLQDDASRIAARLTQQAQQSQRDGDIRGAARDFRLAAQLSGDAALESKAQQLDQQLQQVSVRTQQKQRYAAQVTLADDLLALDAMLEKNELDAAQALLKSMRARYAGSAGLALREQRFEQQRQKFVAASIARGKRYYSAGELNRAIESWEAAYLLDADNADLRDRIDRAQRFRAKVESLQ